MPELAQEIHISSLVVHCQPNQLAQTRKAIDRLHGTETHHQDASGKLVVVLESDNEQTILDTVASIETLAGVLAATLVYHHVDSADAIGDTP